jgi:hypothetical protein
MAFQTDDLEFCGVPCHWDSDCLDKEFCERNAIAIQRGGMITNTVGYCAVKP